MRSLFFSVCLLATAFAGYASIPRIAPETALNTSVDSIVVLKAQRQMEVYHHGQFLKSYRVCLGPSPVGPKHFRNDGKTPEGIYYINGKYPNSHYHKALSVSYPSAADMAYARQHGKPAGGDIRIHGLPNAFKHEPGESATDDWTLGCIAVNDEEIDELFAHVNVGVYVNILP